MGSQVFPISLFDLTSNEYVVNVSKLIAAGFHTPSSGDSIMTLYGERTIVHFREVSFGYSGFIRHHGIDYRVKIYR